MSGSPIDDVSVILDEILYPMLTNPKNQIGWPDVITKDIDSHIQELRNVIAEVRKCLVMQRMHIKMRLSVRSINEGSLKLFFCI